MGDQTRKNHRTKRNIAFLLLPLIFFIFVVYALWKSHPETAYWLNLFSSIKSYIEANPWALVLALATLPGLGFPISPLLILFGIALPPLYGLPATLALAYTAQGLCTTWTYALARGPLYNLLTQYILRERKLPKMTQSNTMRLGLFLRLTPGIPYAMQNIILGIMGMPVRSYLLVSIPTTSMWSTGFIVTGGAIFKGQFGWAAGGIVFLVALMLAIYIWRRKNTEYVG
jgi:uncharacterized membrane protein YdjX (TVP38/TMEM64 family)